MTIKLIISGSALCAMTAAAGIGLSILNEAAHAPQRIALEEEVARQQVLARAESAARHPEPEVLAAAAEAEPERDLFDDLQITFVAARAPNDVAASLAPERSITPLMRVERPRPAVVRSTPRPAPQVQQQRRAQPTPVVSRAANAAPATQLQPNWVVGVWR